MKKITKMTDATDRANMRLLKGNCWIIKVIHKATVRKEVYYNHERIYIGATELNWKNKWYNHYLSFTNRKYDNSTTLSSI